VFIAREPYSVNKTKAVSLVRRGDGQDSSKMEIMEWRHLYRARRCATARPQRGKNIVSEGGSEDARSTVPKNFRFRRCEINYTHHMGSAIASANFWLLFGHQCL